MKTKPQFVSVRKIKAVLVACCAICFLPACASRSPFQKGYERGTSDTVKRQYWILQDMQKRDEPKKPHLYRMPVEPDPNASVKRVPYEITIPVYE